MTISAVYLKDKKVWEVALFEGENMISNPVWKATRAERDHQIDTWVVRYGCDLPKLPRLDWLP